jgi:hypothetical protein
MTVEAAADEAAAVGPRTQCPSYDDAVCEFLDFLRRFRGCSEQTIRSYGAVLRGFRASGQGVLGSIPPPREITRELIFRYGVGRHGIRPRTLQREYGCLSSCFSFLRDMGCVEVNPASRLPHLRGSQPSRPGAGVAQVPSHPMASDGEDELAQEGDGGVAGQ